MARPEVPLPCFLRFSAFKLRELLATPSSEIGPFTDPSALQKIVRRQHIVVIHKYQNFTLRLADRTQASVHEANFAFSSAAGMRVPGEITGSGQRNARGVINQKELPFGT